MKKSIFALVVILALSGTIPVGCKSNTDKEADAEQSVQDAEANQVAVNDDIKEDANKKANDEEWQTFKAEANATIDANETRIKELKAAIKKPGNTFDATYAKNIDDLESKNAALRKKIANYENNQTDWSSFKREFESDMTSLGESLKDLTVNNKK